MKSRGTTDGLLLVDKPAGISSHDAVLAARRAFGESRIGHGGTLDPFATGLLVLLLGRATRLLPYLNGEPKVYQATIRFGSETDTDDLGGQVTRTAVAPTGDAVLKAIPKLMGTIQQMPPAYSAKRVDGKRAYQAAREGKPLELKPVPVRVDGWQLIEWDGDDLRVEIMCGGGTYIRALARDLGRLTDSAAHLVELRRTRSGPFDVSKGVTIADLEAGRAVLRPPLDALVGMPTQPVSPEEINKISRGIEVPRLVSGTHAALVDSANGSLIAVAEGRGERWQPRVVMSRAE
ncbi:MAG: tRNA pseudouridine synthase [Gemmatimonadetes bacterium]|nr:tRNA pseudouridine synthase [Gemmatimonadota bacterium]